MPNKKGTGLLLVMVDVPAEMEDEFNRWYNEEHLPELLAIPGVLNAARYEAVRGGPKHLACYELETPAVVESAAWTSRQPSEWAQRVGPRVIGTNRASNVYQMIHPTEVTPEIAQADMAPALQIGRMDVQPAYEDEWNHWHTNIFAGHHAEVAGCIRFRRWKVVRGSPAYAVVYDFEHEKVSDSPEWQGQRDAHPDNARMREVMTHAPGSPGIWKKTFQL